MAIHYSSQITLPVSEFSVSCWHLLNFASLAGFVATLKISCARWCSLHKRNKKYFSKYYSHHCQLLCSVFFDRSTLRLLCVCNSSGIGADKGTITSNVLFPSHTTMSLCIQNELYLDEFLVYCRVEQNQKAKKSEHHSVRKIEFLKCKIF